MEDRRDPPDRPLARRFAPRLPGDRVLDRLTGPRNRRGRVPTGYGGCPARRTEHTARNTQLPQTTWKERGPGVSPTSGSILAVTGGAIAAFNQVCPSAAAHRQVHARPRALAAGPPLACRPGRDRLLLYRAHPPGYPRCYIRPRQVGMLSGINPACWVISSARNYQLGARRV